MHLSLVSNNLDKFSTLPLLSMNKHFDMAINFIVDSIFTLFHVTWNLSKDDSTTLSCCVQHNRLTASRNFSNIFCDFDKEMGEKLEGV